MHIITIAIGETYRRVVGPLLKGLRQYNNMCSRCNMVSVRCISDIPIENCETIIVPSNYTGYKSRHFKTTLHHYAREGLNLFLDADIEVRKPLNGIWQELGDYDFALLDHKWLPNPLEHALYDAQHKSTPEEYMLMKGFRETGTPFYNSGVILWRHNEMSVKLFNAWHHEWERFRGIDQVALYRAIMAVKPRIKSLDPRFHATPFNVSTVNDPVLFHRWFSCMPQHQ